MADVSRPLIGADGNPIMNPNTGRPAMLVHPDSFTDAQVGEAAREAFAALQQMQPQAAAEIQQATALPGPGSPLPALGQAGQLALGIAKQEAWPSGLAAIAPVVGTALAGGPLGLATRGALAGAGALAGRYTNTALGMQPAPTLAEGASELLLGGSMEGATRVIDPSEAQQIVRALGGTPRATLRAADQAAQIGGVLRRHVGDINTKTRNQLNLIFRDVEQRATARGLEAAPSQDVLDAASHVIGSLDTLGLDNTNKLTVQTAVQRLAAGTPLSFSETRRIWRQVGELGDSFSKTLGRGPRNPLNTLAGALKSAMRTMVAGTPVASRFEKADDYFVNEFLPTTRALHNIDNAYPEDVVNALVSKPPALRRVLNRVDQATADKMRTSWIATALDDSRDLAGLPDVKALEARFRRLKGTARSLIIEDQASFRRSIEQLGELTGREGFINQFRLLQSGALVGMGAGIGAAYTSGNVSAGVAAMLSTTAGVYALARIMNNSAARRLFNKGLARESTNGRVAGRFILQAGERAGIDWFAPELRLVPGDGAGATTATASPLGAPAAPLSQLPQ